MCGCVCVLGETGFCRKMLLHCATWLLLAEMSRNSRELCRYGNNSKERDAEMERDMYCLQRWTNIFVGQHTRSLDDGVFVNECLCKTFFSRMNVRRFNIQGADACVNNQQTVHITC